MFCWLLTGSWASEKASSAADGEMLMDGEALVARVAVLAKSMDAIVMEKRRAAISARTFCLRDILLLFLICC